MTGQERRGEPASGAAKAGGGAGGRGSSLSGAAFAGLGLQFALSILLFLWVGNWLDRKLGTSYLAVLGALVGAVGGFYSLYRKLTAEQKADAARRAAAKAEKAERAATKEKEVGP